MYIERCRHYRETPPPADWGGVWTLTVNAGENVHRRAGVKMHH